MPGTGPGVYHRLGEEGAAGCPDGYAGISTAGECRAASEALGVPHSAGDASVGGGNLCTYLAAVGNVLGSIAVREVAVAAGVLGPGANATFRRVCKLAPQSAKCPVKPRPTICPAGQMLVEGTSTTAADNTCGPCPHGSYAPEPSLAVACRAKSITKCPAGTYFYTRGSSVDDDNACLPCPPGTFTPDTSSATVCTPKAPFFCPSATRYLVRGTSPSENDNMCILDGFCGPGFFMQVRKNSSACARCPTGKFSDTATKAGGSCRDKVTHRCPPGEVARYSDSVTRNATKCERCPASSYNNDTTELCYMKKKHTRECSAGEHVSTYAKSRSPFLFFAIDDLCSCSCLCLCAAASTLLYPVGASGLGVVGLCTSSRNQDTCPYTLFCVRWLHRYDSAAADDHACVPCGVGQFTDSNTTRTACKVKQAPRLCKSGRHVNTSAPFVAQWRLIRLCVLVRRVPRARAQAHKAKKSTFTCHFGFFTA